MDAINARRSIRVYQQKEIPPGLVESLIEAGFCAPSARNQRPWFLVVVRDPATKEALSRLGPGLEPAEKAPLVLVVCAEPVKRWVEDASAFTENLLIRATSLGLGGCWLAVRDKCEAEVKELLGIPDGMRVLCMVSVGYPAEEKEPRKGYPRDRVFWERWGQSR